jgi:hypothetical protein
LRGGGEFQGGFREDRERTERRRGEDRVRTGRENGELPEASLKLSDNSLKLSPFPSKTA